MDTANQETDESLVASTELASELKMAFNQYAKVGRLQILVKSYDINGQYLIDYITNIMQPFWKQC